MISQQADGLHFQLKAPHDFTWLNEIGRVFCVFDQLISGNICFGADDGRRRYFIKYAGAQTLMYAGQKEAAVLRLQAAQPRYNELRHPALTRLLGSLETPEGHALVFEWFEGYALAPLELHLDRLLSLPLTARLALFDSLMDFMVLASSKDYLAAGLSHHHILVDFDKQRALLSSVNHFMRFPAATPHPKSPGSSWFLPDEGYQVGKPLDESATVYALGALAFSFFNANKAKARQGWTAGQPLYELASTAIRDKSEHRAQSAARFQAAWREQVRQLPGLY